MINKTLTLGSLFDGSGGFPLGGLLSGITPVWSSEIEPFPICVTTKRMPFVKHYGDISVLNGAELPPVDIITFGSPCQDMSVAGKRAGLGGSRSNLFYEAIRIIKEMRGATNGEKPRYIVWENVPGAFSSNKGQDFKAVLTAVCSVKETEPVIPEPPNGRWSNAGNIVADEYSVAWRTLDAQFWGVPQRRKRIYLVADFADRSAGEILFESEGLSGYSPQSFRAWQRTAGGAEESVGASSLCLNDQGGNRMDVTDDMSCTLRAEAHHPPCMMESAGFCTEHSSKSRTIGFETEKSPTLRAGIVPAAVALEHYPIDSRIKMSEDGTVQTLTSRMGTGGNNVPLLMKIRAEASRCLDANGGNHSCNQSCIAVVEGNGTRPSHRGCGYAESDVMYALNATEQHSIAYAMTTGAYTQVIEEAAPTLQARDFKDPSVVNASYYVRRLTPTECARLQGFPDWWCDDLETENPTFGEIAFWTEVFETHRKIMGTSKKPKSEKQIIKWLKNPHSDAAEYKMWGNGVSLPIVFFVLSGIVWAANK